jgi:hypothetical protein
VRAGGYASLFEGRGLIVIHNLEAARHCQHVDGPFVDGRALALGRVLGAAAAGNNAEEASLA